MVVTRAEILAELEQLDAIEPRGFLHALLEDAAREAGVPAAVILGPSRRRAIAWPRMRAMARAHLDYGFSLPAIGRVFRRDHTSVLHAVRRYPEIWGEPLL